MIVLLIIPTTSHPIRNTLPNIKSLSWLSIGFMYYTIVCSRVYPVWPLPLCPASITWPSLVILFIAAQLILLKRNFLCSTWWYNTCVLLNITNLQGGVGLMLYWIYQPDCVDLVSRLCCLFIHMLTQTGYKLCGDFYFYTFSTLHTYFYNTCVLLNTTYIPYTQGGVCLMLYLIY